MNLQGIAEAYSQVHEKKDSSYLETDMKKRQENNEKARKDMEKVKGQKNPHFEEAGADEKRMKKFQELQKNVDQKKKNIRGNDSEEQKARLEKKRGMKLDDHPQFKKEEAEVEEGYGAPGHNPGSGEKSVARAKAMMDKKGQKGAPGLDAMAAAKKEHESKRGVKKEEVSGILAAYQAVYNREEEVEDIEEADSLAAMAARREKRLKAQRKREGTTATGQDFGHDYGISDAERKKRQKAEFDAFIGRGKKKTNEELELEGYKGKHGQSDKEYADSRSPGGKMVSGDSKMSGAEYTHGRRVKAANPGMQPDVGGKTKPKSQGKMDKGTRADLTFRKAALRKEELEGNPVYEATKADIKEFVGSAIQGAVNSAGQALATPVGAGLAAGTVGAVTGGKKKVKKSLATGAGAAAGAALGGLPGAVIGGIAGNALS